MEKVYARTKGIQPDMVDGFCPGCMHSTLFKLIGEVLEDIPQIIADPAPEIHLSDYQASSIQYVVRAWTAAADYWTVYYAIQEGVREAFDRHGVEMTYDHLNVHILDRK